MIYDDLENPFEQRSHRPGGLHPDLEDPFAERHAGPYHHAPRVHPDLEDPFAGYDEQRRAYEPDRQPGVGGTKDKAPKDSPKAAKADPLKAERDKLEAAGRAALAGLPETSAADAANTPGNVGQGKVEGGSSLPDWFVAIQSRLVASTTWSEAHENAQLAIRDYAMFIARTKGNGKVPGHIKVFFDYIGRGSKNDAAARRAGYKGTKTLNGAKGAKNWCAGAASVAQELAKREGRVALLEELERRGLKPTHIPAVFFNNLEALSSASKGAFFYNESAYAQPLEPGDRVDYLFDDCQYGGHAVHIVAETSNGFLHVSGNTTKHSAVGIGEAKRLKKKPDKLNIFTANNIKSDETKKKATAHIKTVDFEGGALIYMIQRVTNPHKALDLLETDDPAEFEAACKKLMLKPV